MSRKLTDDDKINIIKDYLTNNHTCESLAKKYLVTRPAIWNILKIRGVVIRSRSDSHRKYTINENYFDIINTEQKAYYLGLLYADGCNSPKTNSIKISLQESDISILDRFNIEINSNRPLNFVKNKNPKRKNFYILNITSKRMSEQLTKLGCFTRKSLILKFPTEEQVPANLIQHFIRGYFDGDGSFYFYKNKSQYKKLQISLTSTLDFCNYTKDTLYKILTINCGIYRPKYSIKRNTTTRELRISGNKQVKIFLDWLYKDATIWLDRKYEKYKSTLVAL